MNIRFLFFLLLALPQILVSPGRCEAESYSMPFSVVSPIISGRVSSTFGMRKHPIDRVWKHHQGIDFAVPSNSHVRAVASGTVVYADWYAGYGKLVTVEHGEGFVSLYGHLNEIKVSPGQKIKSGDIIGAVGSTGKSTGAHLHFEWRFNSKPLDPLRFFPYLVAEPQG